MFTIFINLNFFKTSKDWKRIFLFKRKLINSQCKLLTSPFMGFFQFWFIDFHKAQSMTLFFFVVVILKHGKKSFFKKSIKIPREIWKIKLKGIIKCF
jgi:hypothetical protein